jgi:hypothetical protein
MYSITDLVRAYMIAIVGNLLCLVVAPPLVIVAYFVAGVALSRYVGQRILWWNMAANIQNVYQVKLATIATWPIAIPSFIWKLFVAKHF